MGCWTGVGALLKRRGNVRIFLGLWFFLCIIKFMDFSRLHREVDAFVKWISPSPVEDEIRSLIVIQISNVIRSVFADAAVYPFGSYSTKLYLPLG